MVILETMFTLFFLVIILSAIEVYSLLFKGRSFIVNVCRKFMTTKFKVAKSKSNSLTVLKEIKNQLIKYEDRYSNWNKKVGRFQLELFYEVEGIVNFLDNTNDETQMEFDSTYRETVWTIYKLLKENEFIVTKKEHGAIYPMLKELKEDAKDILEISNTVKAVNKSDLLNIETEYIKRMRENRQMMKEVE